MTGSRESVISRRPTMDVWTASGDFTKGLDAPSTTPVDVVLQAFLGEESLPLDKLTPDERAEAEKHLTFLPQFSVLKRDWDDIGDYGDSGWHTEGSGKRRRESWWVDYQFDALVYRIIDRLQAECPHPEWDEFWCKECGMSKRKFEAAS